MGHVIILLGIPLTTGTSLRTTLTSHCWHRVWRFRACTRPPANRTTARFVFFLLPTIFFGDALRRVLLEHALRFDEKKSESARHPHVFETRGHDSSVSVQKSGRVDMQELGDFSHVKQTQCVILITK